LNKLRHVTAIFVGASVAECWDSGAEILILSLSLDASGFVVNKISALSGAGSTAAITLENNMKEFISLHQKDLMKGALSCGRLNLFIEVGYLLSIKHQHICFVVTISHGITRHLARDSWWKKESQFLLSWSNGILHSMI